MNIEQASLDALNHMLTGMNKDPESRQAYQNAEKDLQAFLQRHQYYGEAAVMVAALTLAQDEETTNPPTDENR